MGDHDGQPIAGAAQALAALGAEVVRSDSADRSSLESSIAGAYGVYNVQNHHISGLDVDLDTAPTLEIHPDARSVRTWLAARRSS